MIQTANDIFVLHTAHTTYAFRKLPTGQLEHLYMEEKSMYVSLWMKMRSHL